MKRHLAFALAALLCAGMLHAKDIRITHGYGQAGPLEAHAKHTNVPLLNKRPPAG